MTSDESRRARDVAFKPVGTGMPLTLSCFYCGKRKIRAGGRFRGPFKKLFSCQSCEEEREQTREQKP